MIFIEMSLELFATIENLSAFKSRFAADLGVRGVGEEFWLVAALGTLPGFNLPVDAVFVAFPVVLAAEAAGAVGVGATVGPCVSFMVFSILYHIMVSRYSTPV